jgi:sulfatase modifying factor 1
LSKLAVLSSVLLVAIVGCSLSAKVEFSSSTKNDAGYAVADMTLPKVPQPMETMNSDGGQEKLTSNVPDNMQEVKGEYCPEVQQDCIKLDKSIHNVNGYVKCDEFAPSKCLSKERKHLDFYIDTYEASDKKGELPPVMITYNKAEQLCKESGKRLCKDYEWTFACEGEDMLPYPYGLTRSSESCNIDHLQKPGFDASKDDMTPEMVSYLDQRVPSGSMDGCVSVFGVRDLTGNTDEQTINSAGIPHKNALKGGHWVRGARNKCRPATLIHSEGWSNYESSYRCCKDITE